MTVNSRAGSIASGKTERGIPSTVATVGRNWPIRPSCSGWAPGAFTTPVEV